MMALLVPLYAGWGGKITGPEGQQGRQGQTGTSGTRRTDGAGDHCPCRPCCPCCPLSPWPVFRLVRGAGLLPLVLAAGPTEADLRQRLGERLAPLDREVEGAGGERQGDAIVVEGLLQALERLAP